LALVPAGAAVPRGREGANIVLSPQRLKYFDAVPGSTPACSAAFSIVGNIAAACLSFNKTPAGKSVFARVAICQRFWYLLASVWLTPASSAALRVDKPLSKAVLRRASFSGGDATMEKQRLSTKKAFPSALQGIKY
jgi:hypothetical protein